jgi:purine-binding chemotaxis protein CheW
MNKERQGREKPSINWKEILQRIETLKAAAEQSLTPAFEEKKRILKERAKALAKEQKDEDKTGESIEVVEFQLAYERYGIEASYVREVYPLKELTPLPCTPSFVLGVINVRGQILSVIDLKKFFDLPEKGLTDLNKVIILRSDGMEFGILADVILGTRNILLTELQQSIPTLTGLREEYLRGVTQERVVILDAGKLLEDKKIIVHEEA